MILLNRHVCRCCLTENPIKYSNLFESENINNIYNINNNSNSNNINNLQVKLKAFLPKIIIQQNDGLPDIICSLCALNLENSLEFQNACLNADRVLRRSLNETNKVIDAALGLNPIVNYESTTTTTITQINDLNEKLNNNNNNNNNSNNNTNTNSNNFKINNTPCNNSIYTNNSNNNKNNRNHYNDACDITFNATILNSNSNNDGNNIRNNILYNNNNNNNSSNNRKNTIINSNTNNSIIIHNNNTKTNNNNININNIKRIDNNDLYCGQQHQQQQQQLESSHFENEISNSTMTNTPSTSSYLSEEDNLDISLLSNLLLDEQSLSSIEEENNKIHNGNENSNSNTNAATIDRSEADIEDCTISELVKSVLSDPEFDRLLENEAQQTSLVSSLRETEIPNITAPPPQSLEETNLTELSSNSEQQCTEALCELMPTLNSSRSIYVTSNSSLTDSACRNGLPNSPTISVSDSLSTSIPLTPSLTRLETLIPWQFTPNSCADSLLEPNLVDRNFSQMHLAPPTPPFSSPTYSTSGLSAEIDGLILEKLGNDTLADDSIIEPSELTSRQDTNPRKGKRDKQAKNNAKAKKRKRSRSCSSSSDSEVLSTDSKKSLHACTQCDKKFTRNFQLKLHLISVHNLGDGLQYPCRLCDKTFASKHSLNYHMKSMHTEERPFVCKVCDRSFVLRGQLASHERVHTGESRPRIHECLKCGKTWPTKADLRLHMRSHMGDYMERPFRCDKCDKRFFTKGHLTSHELVHSGEKPYTCTVCKNSYQSVGNLNNHLVRRHPELMFTRQRKRPTAAAIAGGSTT